MIFTRLIIGMLLFTAGLVPIASQAATRTVGAIGPTVVNGWGTCHGFNTGIDFELHESEFLLQVGHFPPVNATIADPACASSFAMSNQFGNRFPAFEVPCGLPYHYAIKPDALTISGNTYTITNSFRHCNGVISNQTTKITVNATTIAFQQTYIRTDGTSFSAIGTLTRLW